MKNMFPKAIEIQTTSHCNARCIICPHFEIYKEKPSGSMKDDLFEKIISECIPYQKELLVIPYLNGEPFLDKKIFNRLKILKAYLPESNIEISTNLSMLTKEVQNELSNYKIFELRISLFGFTEQTYKRMMPGLNWNEVTSNLKLLVQNNYLRKNINKVSLTMIEHEMVPLEEFNVARKFCDEWGLTFNGWGFLDRAGNVPSYKNKIDNTKRIKGCEQNRPNERLHICYDGKVILCCQDWRREEIIGDLNDLTIQELWNSAAYENYRLRISGGNELSAPNLCENCNLAVRL